MDPADVSAKSAVRPLEADRAIARGVPGRNLVSALSLAAEGTHSCKIGFIVPSRSRRSQGCFLPGPHAPNPDLDRAAYLANTHSGSLRTGRQAAGFHEPSVPAAVRLGASRVVLQMGIKLRETVELIEKVEAVEAWMTTEA